MSEMPKEGYTYCEISIPDKGLTLSGAMDDNSLENIINITLDADVDRDHTRADLAQKQAEMSDNDDCFSESGDNAIEALWRLEDILVDALKYVDFMKGMAIIEKAIPHNNTIRNALEQAEQYRDAVRDLAEIKENLDAINCYLDDNYSGGKLPNWVHFEINKMCEALTNHAETIKRAENED